MHVGSVTKSPYEVVKVSVDFVPVMSAGVTITSFAVLVFDRVGRDVTALVVLTDPPPTNAEDVLIAWVRDGSLGEAYYIAFRAVLSDGHQLEGVVKLLVI